MRNRILSLLLIALTLLSTLFACADNTVEANADTAAVTETAEPEDEGDMLEKRLAVSDGLPDTDYEGRAFRILADDYSGVDFIVEEQSGDVIDDAVFTRNSNISDRFNVEIKTDELDYTTVSTQVRNFVASADDAYDIVINHVIESGKNAKNHCYADWNTVDNVDFSQPWWNQSAHEEMSVAGKSFINVGSMNIYFLRATYCVYYNKKLAEDYHVGDINGIVSSGGWTIDKMTELVSNSWDDLNGNGKADGEDIFGLVTNSSSYSTTYIYSFGEKTVSRDENGVPRLDMKQEKFADMVSKVYKMYYESNGSYALNAWSGYSEVFIAGRALFLNNTFSFALGTGREMELDFGIIPYPKWDEAQSEYYTMSDGSHPTIGIPTTAVDTDFIGMISEAMNCESWKRIIPAVYDVALKTKGTRDEESVAMIDMINNSIVLDFGFVYADYDGIGFTMSTLMSGKKSDFASYYAKNESKWTKKLETVVEAFIGE